MARRSICGRRILRRRVSGHGPAAARLLRRAARLGSTGCDLQGVREQRVVGAAHKPEENLRAATPIRRIISVSRPRACGVACGTKAARRAGAGLDAAVGDEGVAVLLDLHGVQEQLGCELTELGLALVLEDGKETLPCLDGAVACREVQQSAALVG